MESYYFCPFELWHEWAGPKNHFVETHWVETDEPGIIFMVATFRHKADRWLWEKEPGVETLPHPQDPAGYLEKKHADRLARYGVKDTHRTIEAAELASKLNILLRYGGV